MNKNRSYFLKANLTVKALSVFIVMSLLLSVAPALMGTNDSGTEYVKTKEYIFSVPETVSKDNNYIELSVNGATPGNILYGAPLLPKCAGNMWFPMGTIINDVVCTFSGKDTMILPEGVLITPSPAPIPLTPPDSPFENIEVETHEEIYSLEASFPSTRFNYDVAVGRDPNGNLGVCVYYTIQPAMFDNVKGGIISYVTSAGVSVTYEMGSESTPLYDDEGPYDLLILSPSAYLVDLEPLINHKEAMGLKTKLVCLDEIYAEDYFDAPDGLYDNQEKIKYFIYTAINEWNITYCMAVGGFRTFFGLDVPSMQFPMRWISDPTKDETGYISDMYYSCCIKSGGAFDNWDKSGNHVYGELKDHIDLFADVFFGRIACRNRAEVQIMVDKIINYETTTYGEDWFNRMLGITGDGFQDGRGSILGRWRVDLEDNGMYTVYAQSCLSSDTSVKGPIDSVTVCVDHDAPSRITFTEDDHLKVQPLDPENQTSVYPGFPVAEIVVPSDDDILGNTEVYYVPTGGYQSAVGSISYSTSPSNYGLVFVVKSYDPSPKDSVTPISNFASKTNLKVWVKDSNNQTVYSKTIMGREVYYEGEAEVQKAMEYLDDSIFEETKLWTSNGQWTGMWDVINEINTGYGIIYFAGHGNPMSWGDHLPGIPGGRGPGTINGLKNVNLDFGWARYESEEGDPFFPMNHLRNDGKQSIILVGGCHNAMVDVSLTRLLYDPHNVLFSYQRGAWVPECFNWWLINMPQGGGVASFGCSGLGYGRAGDYCLLGLNCWQNFEFINEYANNGYDMIGETYTRVQTRYASGEASEDCTTDVGGLKTFQEWMFLGDPSLKIGGYPPSTGDLQSLPLDIEDVVIGKTILVLPGTIQSSFKYNGDVGKYFNWAINISGISPLAQYLSLTGTIFENLLCGHILSGSAEETVFLSPGESIEILSNPALGFGHVNINISVSWEDNGDEFVVYKKVLDASMEPMDDDGFLIGSRLLLWHPEV